MVSVSRIILLQSSRPWRASETPRIPPTRGRRLSRKSELARAAEKSGCGTPSSLKVHLISKKNVIAEAMP
jgi:hypothetical protein